MAVDPLAPFHAATRAWFRAALGEPTRAQRLGWPPIARGESTLLLAPTGSGKTLAAFLAALDRLMFSTAPDAGGACRVLYVSPLKALAVDVEKNLQAPLTGIAEAARRLGISAHVPTVGIRSGDTPQADRARMLRTPPEILITTPESLFLLLTSRAREALATVDAVIVDEIHALASSKRGAHLFVSLERLEALRPRTAPPLQRIGLSATQRPLEEVARLLGGYQVEAPARAASRRRARPSPEPALAAPVPRPVTVVDAGEPKSVVVEVRVPDIDMARLGDLEEPASGPAAAGPTRRSIWPHLHEQIVALVRAHRSTMIFVNSRRLAERLAGALNELAGEELALAHHGSVAREQRAVIEDRLKRGDLPAIVATSSLELGIDMGAVDLVIQVESPPSVASGLQRVGRAGHSVGDTSRGIFLPKQRAELLACAATVAGMRTGSVEETRYPRNPLDVLAQQVVAIASVAPVGEDELFDLVRSAAPFAMLPRTLFHGVLDMLSGRYPSDDFADLRARLTWDRTARLLTARAGAARLAVANAGTIPDRGLYGVFLAAGAGEDPRQRRRVGELDEEMVFEMREGDVFLLGASSWRAEEISRDHVLVTPAPGQPGRMPFWHGDRPGRPLELGEAMGALARSLSRAPPERAMESLRLEHGFDESAARNLLAYLADEVAATGEVPSDRVIVFQRFQDELRDWRVCLLSPFGARVHAPWASAVLERLKEDHPGDLEAVWSDDGMAFRIPASEEPPPLEWFLLPSAEAEARVTRAVGQTALFAAHFRECAGRSLLLPRRRPGLRTPLWAQRKRAADLLGVAAQHPTFPILLETYRECLQDVFDLPGLVGLLARIEQRRLRVVTVDTRGPSPFAAALLFSYAANFIYETDAPLAERRAQALTIDHEQLRALLGEPELRSLLDVEAIAEHELRLQGLARQLRHADDVHDLLLAVGDLSRDELAARGPSPRAVTPWLDALVAARRVVRVPIGGEPRFVAAEDAGKLRDALGVVPPRGLPAAFLTPVAHPLVQVVARYARTHGPFTPDAIAARYALSAETVVAALRSLAERGRVVEGSFLPGRRGVEYCDAEVLRTLRQRSLARLRAEVEPVDESSYARFLVEWQLPPRRGLEGLLEAVRQLEGYPLPASTLEGEVLPARVEGFRPSDLDYLCATGAVVWAGIEPLGPSDGRIALYLAEDEASLARPVVPLAGDAPAKVRALLERRGAMFFAEMARELGGFLPDLVATLWEMVWAGEVTNDTFAPVRSLVRAASSGGSKGGTRLASPRRPGAERWRGMSGRGTQPGVDGRWSLRGSRWGIAPSPTEAAAATARSLLERYGVVTAEGLKAELVAGGFSRVYSVYRSMEQAGRIRRGYFVARRGATQFALPGADERLRALREPSREPVLRVLGATDPASPYGASLPWPAARGPADKVRPQRAAGCQVILLDGVLLGWLGRNRRALLTFGEPTVAAGRGLADGLRVVASKAGRGGLLVTTVDGQPVPLSPWTEALVARGFSAGARGLLVRPALGVTQDGSPPEARRA